MMYSLSPEIKQGILSALTDIFSLHSTACSYIAIRDAFFDSEKLITNRILQKTLDSEIIHDAMAAERLRLGSVSSLNSYIDPARSLTLRNLSLIQALSMGRLDACVQYFAEDMIIQSLAHPALSLLDKGSSCPATRTETTRIQRALYRFQILCRFLGDSKNAKRYAKIRQFMSNFSH
jgi:hypothetical protein